MHAVRRWRPGIHLHRLAGISFLIIGTLLGGCSKQADDTVLAVGMPVPNLLLKSFDGSRDFLSAFQGRLLVLNVWAPWCGPCLDEMPSLDRLNLKLDQQRFAVIGLTVDDDRFLAEEFLLKNKISFSNYLDERRHIVEEILGVTAFPQTFLISPDRHLLARVTGWQDWDTEEVVAALERQYQSHAQQGARGGLHE